MNVKTNLRGRHRHKSAKGQLSIMKRNLINDLTTDGAHVTSTDNVILGPTASRAGGRGGSSIGEMAGFGRMPTAPSAGYHPVAA